MSQFDKFNAQGGFSPFSDGFGGVSALYFASPVETLPRVPTLPQMPSPIPTRDYGTQGNDGAPVHGAYGCKEHGCGFSGPSEHGLMSHAMRTHGAFRGR